MIAKLGLRLVTPRGLGQPKRGARAAKAARSLAALERLANVAKAAELYKRRPNWIQPML